MEYFPPVMNMARFFALQDQWDVSVCTNRNQLGRQDFSSSSVTLIRGSFPTGKRGIKRIFSYLSFHLKSLDHLLTSRPDVILYIEPHSALPVFLSRLIRRKGRLFIHYHEYHRPDDFDKPGMRMARWCNHLEKAWLYPVADWISQTNEDRLKLFLKDHPGIDPSRTGVLPNYPPASWWSGRNKAWQEVKAGDEPIRMVYVGALSRADTFIEEVVTWIVNLASPAVTLDIFSFNMHEETRTYLKNVANERIRLHEGGVDYDDLPDLLREYHVGLILYRGNTPNYVYNASNKLFEYLACGLDVIYPRQMKGVKPYARSSSKPRVIECDFERIDIFSYTLDGRELLPPAQTTVTCESVLAGLEKAMLQVVS